MITRLARAVLRDELGAYEDDLRLLRDRNVELERRVAELADDAHRLLYERDRARRVADDAVRSRLEIELLRHWARLSFELDEPPRHGPAAALAGELICRKVPLHTQSEGAQFMAKIQRETGYPEDLEVYRCTICPRHPLVGRVRHVRHAETQLDRRRLDGTQRAELRSREPLTQPLAPELLALVRARVAAQTAERDR